MKQWKSTLLSIALLSVSALFEGCSDTVGSLTSMTAIKTDLSMPTIQNVKTVVDKTSIGFEWQPVKDKRVEGIDIYRGIPTGGTQKMKKIATIGNRYATHYVDTEVRPGQTYLYTFKTFGVLFGSAPGAVVKVKSAPPLPAVDFAKAYLADSGVVKLLWVPHSYPGIADYMVERRLGGGEWKYLATVKGRLNPEYIDMSAARGRQYSYRIVARTADGIRALPSQALSVDVR